MKSEVSYVMKYSIFAFNVIVWLIGACLIAVGAWAINEKKAMGNLQTLTNISFDPAMIIIIGGLVLFTIAFFGCVGSLRENTILLSIYSILILIILLIQIGLVIAIFLYSNEVETGVKKELLKYIEKYRDDPDMQDIIDWVQMDWLGCCGIENFRDWERNIYFNCSSPAIEACGVPYSCCKNPESNHNAETEGKLINLQCGFGALNDGTIFEYQKGCFPTFKDWVKNNMVPIAGIAVFIAVLQILAICFACTLRSDINAQKAKWLRTQPRQ